MRKWILVATLPWLAICACSDSPVKPEEFEYLDYSTPDNLVANVLDAWLRMDFDEYQRMLYDGELMAPDQTSYSAFKFYLWDCGNPWEPLWGLEEELAYTELLLNGASSGDSSIPGVESIHVELFAFIMPWYSLTEAFGDSCPPGTSWHRYQSFGSVDLKGPNPDTGISAFHLNDEMDFYVIPVSVGESIEYRLWKWCDWGNSSQHDPHVSWAVLKSSYCP